METNGTHMLDSKYVDPFIVGIKHVFKTMLNIDLTDKEPFAKESRRTTADVTGIMGFTGDRRGTMTFSTSASCALAIYQRLMGEQFDQITPEIVDAMGEFTNIISGQARKELEKVSLHLTAHVPMVFVGKNIEISYITKGTIVSIPLCFTTNGKTEQLSLDCVFE